MGKHGKTGGSKRKYRKIWENINIRGYMEKHRNTREYGKQGEINK